MRTTFDFTWMRRYTNLVLECSSISKIETKYNCHDIYFAVPVKGFKPVKYTWDETLSSDIHKKLEDCGVYAQYPKTRRIVEKLDPSKLGVWFYAKCTREEQFILTLWCITWFLYDDIVGEDHKEFEFEKVMDCFAGELKDEMEPRSLLVLINELTLIFKAKKGWETWGYLYVAEMRAWMNTLDDQIMMLEKLHSTPPPTVEEFMHWRWINAGGIPSSLIQEYALSNPIPQSVIENPHTQAIIGLVNALITFQNEIAGTEHEKDGLNLILLMEKEFQLDRQSCIERVWALHEIAANEFSENCQMLLKQCGEEARDWIELQVLLAQGMAAFHNGSKRY